MSRRARIALVAGVAGATALVALACKDEVAHVFGAYRYDPAGDCLEGAAAVDVVDGPDPGACAAVRCWLSPDGDVYVTSTACDAPADYKEHTTDPTGSVCALAIAAFERPDQGACGADGGAITGDENDASEDAGDDADR